MANPKEQYRRDQEKMRASCKQKKLGSEATNRKIHARWRAIAPGKPPGQERRPQ